MTLAGSPGATRVHDAAVPSKVEPAAVVALVLALLSTVVWFVPALVALVLSVGAKRNIAASEGQRTGSGMVLAARIISVVSLLLAALVVIVVAWL